MKILIVEDQENLAKMIRKGLSTEGFTADYVTDGEAALSRIRVNRDDYDLVVLDFMLPKKNGLEVCSEIRSDGITTPILMLTARDAKSDIVAALNAGVDDYLTKPFSFEELIARIHAILRRPKSVIAMELIAGNIKLDPVTRCVTCRNKPVHLTLREYGLLEYMMRHPGEALSRDTILSGVWDFAFDSFANVVDVHVTNLRKKLGDSEGKLIETVRGIGYKINA